MPRFVLLYLHITSNITKITSYISASEVVGAIFDSSVIWIKMRLKNQRKNGKYSYKHLAKDISYITPIATLLGIFVYNPTVYFLSHYLINLGTYIIVSVIFPQTIVFTTLIIGLNIYRHILLKTIGKQI